MTTPGGQMTPNDIVMHLVKLGQELNQAVGLLKTVGQDAAQKRADYKVAYARAYIKQTTGSIELRKHQATLDTENELRASEVAEAIVKHVMEREFRAIGQRIDIGRSAGAALREELKLSGYGDTP